MILLDPDLHVSPLFVSCVQVTNFIRFFPTFAFFELLRKEKKSSTICDWNTLPVDILYDYTPIKGLTPFRQPSFLHSLLSSFQDTNKFNEKTYLVYEITSKSRGLWKRAWNVKRCSDRAKSKSLSSVSTIRTATLVENDETARRIRRCFELYLPLWRHEERGPAGRQQQRIFSRAARRIHDLDSSQAFSDRRKQACAREEGSFSPWWRRVSALGGSRVIRPRIFARTAVPGIFVFSAQREQHTTYGHAHTRYWDKVARGP